MNKPRGTFLPSGNPTQTYHGNIGLEDLLDELVPGGVDKLDDVPMQGVSVLLQEAWAVIKSSHTAPAGSPHARLSLP
jgi:hypothetical protein